MATRRDQTLFFAIRELLYNQEKNKQLENVNANNGNISEFVEGRTFNYIFNDEDPVMSINSFPL